MSLHACPGCLRHLRASSTACPFCGSAVHFEERPASEGSERPNRVRMLFGVGVGVVAVSTALLGSACAAYGAPSVDASTADVPSGGDTGGGAP